MFDSAILEVIIGMVFVYSLLSILVTQINAIISNALNLRARHLRDAIDDLLTDPVLRAKIFGHPLIRLIPDQILPAQRVEEEQAEDLTKGKLNAVSWIAPETFVNVLLNVIKVDADQDLFGALLHIIDDMPAGSTRRTLRLMVNRIQTTGEGLDELRDFIKHMGDSIYRQNLWESLDQIDDEIGQIGMDPNSIVAVIAGLRKVKNPYFRTAMETVLSTSQTLDDAQEKLSSWFNDGMSRASESFGRSMQQLSLIVGLVLALVVNVDSLQLAKTLWENPALRTAVAVAAENTDLSGFVDEQQPTPEPGATESVPPAESEGGAAQDSMPVDTAAEDDVTIEDLEQSVEAATQTVEQLLALQLPMGWYFENPHDDGQATEQELSDHRNLWNYFPGNNSGWLGMLLAKLAGLVATMIAISQGAPFWFNILNRLTGRGGG